MLVRIRELVAPSLFRMFRGNLCGLFLAHHFARLYRDVYRDENLTQRPGCCAHPIRLQLQTDQSIYIGVPSRRAPPSAEKSWLGQDDRAAGTLRQSIFNGTLSHFRYCSALIPGTPGASCVVSVTVVGALARFFTAGAKDGTVRQRFYRNLESAFRNRLLHC